VVVMVLTMTDAVTEWRALLGPTDARKARESHPDRYRLHHHSNGSIRAVYGTDNQRNAAHGSDSIQSADREIRFFFPNSTTLASMSD
jgi:nucleoside-diphosphate kinase